MPTSTYNANLPLTHRAQTDVAELTDHRSPGAEHGRILNRHDRLARFAVLLPIFIVTAFSAFESIRSIALRLSMPFPQNPWESAIVADAWRFAHGQRIYEALPNGHATHLYGPLTSISLGVIFKITGAFNLYIGRSVTLISALAACTMLLIAFTPRRKPFVFLIGTGLLLALHYRGRAYFVETRPDMIALMLATTALFIFFRAHERNKFWWYLPGICFVLGAMLFKQTYAACAAVPLAAILFTQRKPLWRNLLIALSPLIACAGMLILIKLHSPLVYFYTVKVPTMYEVSGERIAFAGASLIMLSPLFVGLVMWAFSQRDISVFRTPKMKWLIAACCIGCAAGIPAFAKRGGSYNSLLLGFVPTTTFCVAMLDPLLTRLLTFGDVSRWINAAGGFFVAILIAVTTFAVPKSQVWDFEGANGAFNYAAVIEDTSRLTGRIISPDDPTILIAAKGVACRSLEAELDATGRTGALSTGFAKEINRANYMIRVHSYFDEDSFTGEIMEKLGFARIVDPRISGDGFKRAYSLWKRVKPPTTQASTATTRPKKHAKLGR